MLKILRAIGSLNLRPEGGLSKQIFRGWVGGITENLSSFSFHGKLVQKRQLILFCPSELAGCADNTCSVFDSSIRTLCVCAIHVLSLSLDI